MADPPDPPRREPGSRPLRSSERINRPEYRPSPRDLERPKPHPDPDEPVAAGSGRLGIAERLLSAVRTLTLTNVLIIALIVLIAVPTYAAYRFLTDGEFRREFLQRADLIDASVPCIVLRSSGLGKPTRYTVGMVYAVVDRLERVVAIRSAGPLNDTEIVALCQQVLATGDRLRGPNP